MHVFKNERTTHLGGNQQADPHHPHGEIKHVGLDDEQNEDYFPRAKGAQFVPDKEVLGVRRPLMETHDAHGVVQEVNAGHEGVEQRDTGQWVRTKPLIKHHRIFHVVRENCKHRQQTDKHVHSGVVEEEFQGVRVRQETRRWSRRHDVCSCNLFCGICFFRENA